MNPQVFLCALISSSSIYIASSNGFCEPEPNRCTQCTTLAHCQTEERDAVVPQNLPSSIQGIDILYRGEETATLTPSLFVNYPKLINITLIGAKIGFIETGTFSGVRHLERLSIYKTTITHLPQRLLPAQSKVKFIDFGNNLLTDIPSHLFQNLPKLTHLDLGFNQIILESCTTIGEDFKHLPNLSTLHLANMTINKTCKSQVPDDFFLPLQETVEELNLTISNIYDGSQRIFANFSRLLSLDISIAEGFTDCPARARNLFKQMPKTLQNLHFRRWRTNRIMNKACVVTNETLVGLSELPNLRKIDTMFSDFMFGDILNKSVFSGFERLEILNIGYSRFALIEEYAFENCPNLFELKINGNSVGSRPFKLFRNRSESKLYALGMRECYVYSDYSISYNAAPLLKVSPLHWLELRHNYIVTMPSFADNETDQQHLNSLEAIHLDFNDLDDIQSGGNLTAQCGSLTALRTLTISNNRLKLVQGLCLSITRLDLATNRLYLYWTTVNEASIARLQHLTSLDISDNQILALSSNLTSLMTNLTDFRCADNNLTYIDSSSFFYNRLLEVLDLGNGFLRDFDYNVVKNLSRLTKLFLDDNDITSIDQDLVENFVDKRENLTTFGLIGNPLSCLCDQEFFQGFVKRTSKVPFVNKLKCHDPPSLRGQMIYEYKLRTFECHFKNIVIIAASSLIGVLVAIPLYKYRWYITHVRVVLKAIARHLSDVQFEQTCQYDAYVMYNSSSEEDQMWATQDLRMAVEESSTSETRSMKKLKLYIPDRDALIGSNIYTEMITAMEKSRKIIIVLSNSFLRRPHCRAQADLAGRVAFGRKHYQPHRIMVLVRERLDEEVIKAPFTFLLMENVVDAQTTNERKTRRTWQKIRNFIAQPTYESIRERSSSPEENTPAENNEETIVPQSEDISDTAPLVA